MTKEQAIALSKTDWWINKSAHDIVMFQLWEDKLCMDFGDFHQAVEKALGRSVWTHEFADSELLRAEFLGDRQRPSFDEIIAQIPEAKRVLLLIPPPATAQGGG